MLNDMAETCFVGSNAAGLGLAEATNAATLLSLPEECLEQILLSCDSQTLIALNQTCRALRAFDTSSGLRLVEKIARAAVMVAAGEHAGRWRWVNKVSMY